MALAAALALLVALRVLLPWGLASLGERVGSHQLGRVVRIDELDLELLRGRAVAKGVAVGPLLERVSDPDAPIDPERALLTFTRLGVDWSWWRLLSGELRLLEVSLESPRVAVIRDTDGNLLPIRVAPPEEPEDDEPVADEDDAPMVLVVDVLRIENLGMLLLDLAETRPPIAIELRKLELDALRLADDRLTLGAVALDEPRLTLLRNANLATDFQGAQDEAEDVQDADLAPETADGGAGLEVERIELRNAQLSLEAGDERLDASLAVTATNVSLEAGRRFPVRVDLAVGDGSLELAGEAGANPPAFSGTLEWSGLEIGPLLRAAVPDAALAVASGATDGALRVEALVSGQPDRGPSQVTLSGQVGVDGFDAAERSGDVELAWRDLSVEIARLHAELPGATAPAAPPRIELAAAEIRAPRVVFRRRAAPPAAPDTPAPAQPESAAGPTAPAARPQLRLARLELSEGRFDFEDTSVEPNHQTTLRDVRVRAAGLRWPENQVESLTATLIGPQDSEIALEAALQPAVGTLKLDVKELPLPAYSAYAADAAGYWLEGGSLSLDADARLADQKLALDSDLVLHRLDVAEVSAGSFEKQFGMPLDLALVLLRDPKGRIRLPIHGSFAREGGGGVSLTPIVVSALRQAVLGAIASPIKGVGLLLPGGEESKGMLLAPVTLAPGAVASEGADALGALARLLEARPGLGLVLRGRSGPADDPSLATQRLATAAREGSDLPAVSAGDAGFFERRRIAGALADYGDGDADALARLDAEDAALLQRWIEQVEVGDPDRAALSRQRAAALRERLLAEFGVDADRVRVGKPLAGDPAVVVELAPSG